VILATPMDGGMAPAYVVGHVVAGPATQQSSEELGPIGVPLQQGTQVPFVLLGVHALNCCGLVPPIGLDVSQHPEPPPGPPVPGTPVLEKPHPHRFAPVMPQQPWVDTDGPEPMVEQWLVPPPSKTAQGCVPELQTLVELQSLQFPDDP
jgi:hypothetical protein